MQDGRERIVDGGRKHPEQECDDDGGCNELPRGDAGSARHDEFEPSGQRQITRHRADQHRERHDVLGQLRNAKDRDFGKLRKWQFKEPLGLCPGWHESLNLLGRQIILGHVEKEKERESERVNMEYAVKNAETAAWTYKAEFHDMKQKIFQLEVTIDNLRAVNMRNFDVEVRNRDLEDRLNEMTNTNKELQKTNKDLEKVKTDLMQAIKGLRKELKKEQDHKTDFEDKFNMEQVAGRGC